MILESIVTSVDPHGQVNLTPMGPRVDEAALLTEDAVGIEFILRPFRSSQTYRNVVANGKAVIHVTDDVQLFARSAVDAIEPEEISRRVQRIDQTPWWTLVDCHRWFAVEAQSVSEHEPRVDIPCRVVRAGIGRPFFGLNRAKHAVIEAAILATRTGLLPPDEIREQLGRLQPLVDKTGGAAEHAAFDFLQKTIHDRLATG